MRWTKIAPQLSVFIALVWCTRDAFGEILLSPGGLEGTDRDLDRGLSDKQIGLQNWLGNVIDEAAAVVGDGPWPEVLMSNATGNLELQRDMTSYRYSLAFSAYARAMMSFVHTPAYSSPVVDMLATTLKLFVDARVYSYWGQQGDCAPVSWTLLNPSSTHGIQLNFTSTQAISCPTPQFFLTSYCEEHGVSMWFVGPGSHQLR